MMSLRRHVVTPSGKNANINMRPGVGKFPPMAKVLHTRYVNTQARSKSSLAVFGLQIKGSYTKLADVLPLQVKSILRSSF
jgi:hypothetical protein